MSKEGSYIIQLGKICNNSFRFKAIKGSDSIKVIISGSTENSKSLLVTQIGEVAKAGQVSF